MITSGTIRRFDDLGRIHIPKEVRREAFGKNVNTEGKPMEVFYEKDGTIILKPLEKNRKEFLVSWSASCYCVTFCYMVVANNIEEAKEIWNKFIESDEEIEYSWRKAEKGVKNHYGGYITWEEKDNTDKESGCYKMDLRSWDTSSDHLND